MKTILGVLVLLAGSVVGATMLKAAAISDSLDQNVQFIQTSEPAVMQAVGEVLPSTGTVRIVVNIDDAGKLADWMLIESTHARFADAAVSALKKWSYKPAMVRGQPIGVRTELVFNFEMRGQVVSMTCIDTVAMLMQRISNSQPFKYIYRGGELDAAPKPILIVSPQPVAQTGEAMQQGVLVDFYIDATGKPRMATVDTQGNLAMATSALIALDQWRFTPPTYRGRPVAVRASQWFDFSKAGLAAK